jgi:omega-6 fatty acid desaturase (delta-12 desaturase)
MVFVPKSREEYARRYAGVGRDIAELTEETPIGTLIHLISQQLFGWPMYLFGNVTGHNFHERQTEGRGVGKKNGQFGGVNHFDPRSPLYESKDAKWIVMSDIGIGITAFFLYKAVQVWGAANIAIWYGVPYLWVNHWLGKLPHLLTCGFPC